MIQDMKSSLLKTIILIFLSLLIWNSILHAATREESAEKFAEQAAQYSRQKGKHFLAVAYINRAIKLQPKRAELYYKRAMILGRVGQYAPAISDLNRFVNNKKYPHAIRFRADCFMALGIFQKAAKDYTVFLRFDPKDGKVWSYLTEALALMGRKDLALDAARKGLATGSHWSKRLSELQRKILMGEMITPHKPFSN